MKKPVIIDCDPGIDDAIAIFMALASDKLNVRAITTVAGNVSIDKTTNNALKLTEYIGCDVKIAKGASEPLSSKKVHAEFVHGESGLGMFKIPNALKQIYYKNAYETIYEEALIFEDKLQIIALGPLTNIAITILKYPEVKSKIHQITLMGGSVGYGNHTPAAEFNIYADPEAAKIVFESGIPITMVGLDATNKAYLTEEDLIEIKSFNNRASEFTFCTMMEFLKFCRKYGYNGALMHDPTAVAVVLDDSFIKKQHLHVDIETKGEFTRGKTVVDIYKISGKEPNAYVVLDVDRSKFVEIVKGLLKKYTE